MSDYKNLNFGKLKNYVKKKNNIIYYRRGLNELSLNVTNACPNSCVFCIRNSDPGWGVSNLYLDSDPSVDKIISSFDEEFGRIKSQRVVLEKVKICGYGEPILKFDEVLEVSRHISNVDSNIEIQITTTGWPYFRYISKSDEKIFELKKAGVSSIYLSLNAIDGEMYKKLIRPGIKNIDKKAFSDAIKFGLIAKKSGLKVTLGFIRLKGISDEDVDKFAKNLGFKYFLRDFEN